MKNLYVVYCIEFGGSVKKYVGSTSRWHRRPKEHLCSLRRGRHSNRYLQRAFRKHGEANIRFSILETLNSYNKVLRREGFWIKKYNAADSKFGYNLVPFPIRGTLGYKYTKSQRLAMRLNRLGKKNVGRAAAGPSNFMSKKFVLYSPSGERVKITNLKHFSETHGLNYNKLCALSKDQVIDCEGWKLNPDRQHKKVKSWQLISPEGDEVSITNLRKYCLDYSLPYSSMRQLSKGQISSCRGWKSQFSHEHRGKNVEVLSPEGRAFKVNNLKLFCRKNKISYDSIRKLMHYRGWQIISC